MKFAFIVTGTIFLQCYRVLERVYHKLHNIREALRLFHFSFQDSPPPDPDPALTLRLAQAAAAAASSMGMMGGMMMMTELNFQDRLF